MIEAISTGSVNIAAASTAIKQESLQNAVGVSMLKKTMDAQSSAMLELLKTMGIGNNIDALA